MRIRIKEKFGANENKAITDDKKLTAKVPRTQSSFLSAFSAPLRLTILCGKDLI
jgi:hypothetical protein